MKQPVFEMGALDELHEALTYTIHAVCDYERLCGASRVAKKLPTLPEICRCHTNAKSMVKAAISSLKSVLKKMEPPK